MVRRVRRVLMIGTSPLTMGGISSVVGAYRDGGLFDRMPVSYISTHIDGSAARKMRFVLWAYLQFMGWLLFKPSFLLHVHASSRASFWRKCFFILPARWTNRPVVFHLHGSEFMRFYFEECGPFRQALIRSVMNRCTKIFVLSESWRQNVGLITQNRNVEVLVNPAVRSAVNGQLDVRAGNSLLFLGRLGHRKGIYVLLHALAAVTTRFADVVLLCGGDGEVEKVRSEAERLGVARNVRLLGWVAGEDKARLLATSTVLVLPSFDEGLPMSVLEAMAAGLPVIATPVGGIPEAITPGIEGLLVTPGDASELGDAICKLLADVELRSRMGRNCQARFEQKFSVEKVLGQLEDTYRTLGVAPRANRVARGS